MKKKVLAVAFALLAAVLYALNVPLSKVLSQNVSATMMAALLYLGAGIGLFIYGGISKLVVKGKKDAPLTKKDLPFVILMVVLDIAAPILLMFGLRLTTASNAALLNNFEIVATTVIALVVFKEVVSKKLWIAILIITVSGIILTFEGEGSFTFNEGSLLILGACICWGFENNCTRKISNKSVTDIVVIKGIFSGLGSLVVAFAVGETFPQIQYVIYALLLGFVAYGLSIKFYITAQKDLGAAKTSAYYSVAPFVGVLFGVLFLSEVPKLNFYIALALMIIATIIMVYDSLTVEHKHVHEHTHTHEHRHGDLVHTHEHTHQHCHVHTHKKENDEHEHNQKKLSEHNHTHATL